MIIINDPSRRAYSLMAALALCSMPVTALSGCGSQFQTDPQTPARSTAPCPVESSAMNMSFSSSDVAKQWGAVNDGVMGGKSSGGPVWADDHMIFSGIINTDGGGFSSVRTDVADGVYADADGVIVRVRADERDYKLTFQTSQRWRGRTVSWQAPLNIDAADGPLNAAGWQDVRVLFSDLRPSVFGRSVNVSRFNKLDVQQIGIIIADGEDGPFRLDISQMGTFACTATGSA